MDGINPHATVQSLTLDKDSLRIQVPFSMSISGPSQSNDLKDQNNSNNFLMCTKLWLIELNNFWNRTNLK